MRTHHVWFTTWVNLALVIAIIFLIIVGSVGFFKPLLVPFLIIAIVMSVLGADQGLYSSRNDLQAMGAGYLIFAIAAVIWLLYLTYAESMESSVAGGRPGGGAFGSVPGVSTALGAGAGLAGGAASGLGGGISSAGNAASGTLGGLRNRFSLGKGFGNKGAGDVGNYPNSENVNASDITPSQSQNVPTGVVSHSPSGADASAPMRGVDSSVMPESYSSQGLGGSGLQSPNGPTGLSGRDAPNSIGMGSSSTYPPQIGGDPSLAPPIVGSEQSTYDSNTMPGIASTGGAGANVPGTQESGAPRLQRAEALYSYKASEDDPTEISFNKGDILEIVDSSGKWWQAHRPNGELGIVPSNYLQML